ALTKFWCNDNQFTVLDVSTNTALTELRCDNNQLTELDVNANTALTELRCDNNQLTELDVSNNTALTSLGCENNRLTTLDVSNHTALIGLNCQSNQLPLSELYPISKNKAITRYKDLRYQSLYDTVGQNQTIDLSSQLAFGNPVAQTQFTIALSNNGSADGMYTFADGMLTFTKLGSYKVTMQNDSVRTGIPPSESALTVTAYYEVYDAIRFAWKGSTTEKTITINSTEGFGNIAIDWGDGSIEYYDGGHQTLSHTYADDNSYNVVITADTDTELLEFSCPNTELTALDVSQATALIELSCNSNQLTALDVSNNTALTSLSCNSNQLTALDVSANTALIGLFCNKNQLTELDVSNNTALMALNCNSNQLTALDISANTELTALVCGGNPLTKLDVSANTALTGLDCSNNQLTELDISANTALTGLVCNLNDLTELDVSTNTALISLICDRNPLTKLDVSTNTALNYLYCNSTELAELDVAANTALINLQCANNRLTKLDVSTNTALTGLVCHSNKLTSLDLSANTALDYLSCFSNKLTSLDLSSNTALTDLECTYNILPLSELYKASNLISEAEHKHLGVQNHPLQTVVIGIPYSLAGEMDINGTLTAFVVTQNGNPVVGNIGYEVDYLAETITFLNYGDYQVEMTNSQIVSHPYAPATVIMNFRVANDLIELTWQGSTTEKIIDLQSSSLPDNVWVDWGDGETNTYFNASIDMLIHQYTDTNYYNVTIAALETDAKFTSFDCIQNQITNLDVSHCTALEYIMCGYNQLTTLDVSNCTKLKHLSCSKNQLTTLDISNCAGLEHLSCDENQLTTLEISNCAELTNLSCDENQLTTLDISNCTELTHLSCARNQLTTLDISNCTDLEKLTCFINQLTTLDISNCLILEHLSCDSNRLSTLDISNCTELTSLMCTCNAIPLSILKGFSDAISDPEMKYLGTQTLAPQKTVQGEAFSLAGEMNINGTQTAFVITQNDSIVTEGIDYVLDYSAETITFLSFGSYQVAMTNSQIESHADSPAEVVINFEVRPIGTNANLATLSVSAGTLSPAFNADTTLYNVNVAYEVDEITISATTADTYATVAGTGARKLEVGENPCMIVVTAEDSTIIKAYAVVVTRANNVGIDELRAENEELRIYPNPTSGKVQVASSKVQVRKVEVYDINGKKLSTFNCRLLSGVEASTQEIDLSGFANGVYILRVNDKTTVKVIKE
ncbi:T9SS type A sorting domain-containing protein, partial [Bacteroidales bacterium OttesenSCG-928-C19]|nr:T9SS type A sorting domain-containing protein [Bacteroidales bacterium OttesenSCG-928-C19]